MEGGRDPCNPPFPGHSLLGWVLVLWAPITPFPTIHPHPSGLLGLQSSEAGQLCPGLIPNLSSWAASVCPICRMGWPDFQELSKSQTPGLCDSGIWKWPLVAHLPHSSPSSAQALPPAVLRAFCACSQGLYGTREA